MQPEAGSDSSELAAPGLTFTLHQHKTSAASPHTYQEATFATPGHREGEDRQEMAGHTRVQVKELDLMRCQSQSSLFKQASATRSLSLHKTPSTGSQSIASAVFIQSPATSQQTTVFPVANTQGKYTFNAETQDMQKQDTLWEGSTKLPESTLQSAQCQTDLP